MTQAEAAQAAQRAGKAINPIVLKRSFRATFHEDQGSYFFPDGSSGFFSATQTVTYRDAVEDVPGQNAALKVWAANNYQGPEPARFRTIERQVYAFLAIPEGESPASMEPESLVAAATPEPKAETIEREVVRLRAE
jgi:hypothetical protein